VSPSAGRRTAGQEGRQAIAVVALRPLRAGADDQDGVLALSLAVLDLLGK
jgi:hypothetical protein